MADSVEAHAPILAAGGIVIREGTRPRIAIVRLRRGKDWVLPKGKLHPGERAQVAAKREVLEETGHEVSVHEFLGSMSYPVDSKIKIVQFWHMRAIGGPVRELNHDVKAVKWLPLKEAIDMLSRPHERIFLANVGPVVVKAAKEAVRNQSMRKQAVRTKATKPSVRKHPKRPIRHVPEAPALQLIASNQLIANDQLISNDNIKAAGNPFMKAIGGWIGRIMAQPSIRRMG
jgi:8-oxo-dGTP diphosphatase